MTAGATGTPRRGDRVESRRQVVVRQGRALVRAIREDDEEAVEAAVLALSQSRRIFAPLVFALGAFLMLFQGLRLLFSNWRLTLIQVLPAMWIWLALLDLKAHTFKGKEFHTWHGGVELLLVVVIALVTAAGFYLNAVFAFAISQPGRPRSVRRSGSRGATSASSWAWGSSSASPSGFRRSWSRAGGRTGSSSRSGS